MKRLRKQDQEELHRILVDLERARDFVMSQEVALMKRTNMTSADVFRSPCYPGEWYSRIDREIGSPWTVGLTAIRRLRRALEETR